VKRFVVIVIGVVALSCFTVVPSATGAPTATLMPVPTPTVEGPITSGNGTIVVQSSNFDLANVGYEQAEYFISGTARSYASATPLTGDGKWTVTENGSAPYKTRIVVYRPIDPKRFGGTVMVEWLNVSGGLDAGANWTMAHSEEIRSGMVWVGVTAQKVGIDGGSNALVASQALHNADPVRYGSLEHPGDQFAYDIYSQAAQAVRKDPATVLGGLTPKRLIAVGESQSAFYLTSYANALARETKLFDGFLIHSRAGGAAPFDGNSANAQAVGGSVRIRSDLDIPVLVFITESDLLQLQYVKARQPDSKYFRDWEIAGTSHYDTYSLSFGPKDDGTIDADAAFFDTMSTTISSPYPGIVDCAKPINAGAQTYVARAAVAAMNRWVTTGDVPPHAPRLQLDTKSEAFVLDANGNARGGIRSPHVDAPTATLSGLGQSGTNYCFLFGTTVPFDETKLSTLYPSHAAFVKAWNAATAKAVKAGFILPVDGKNLEAAAAHSTVGGS
jgi:Alpha/beta hydrolase domain